MAYEGRPVAEFVEIDIVQTHLQKAADFVSDRTGPIFRNAMEVSLRHLPSLRFDSPLEVLFWVWWNAHLETSLIGDYLSLRPQAEVTVGNQLYRVDFLVEPRPPELAASDEWRPIAVELDGHEFHERTPEQVAYRDRRDRALQGAGWRVMHFSFREFTGDPSKAVCEVMVFGRDQQQAALAKKA